MNTTIKSKFQHTVETLYREGYYPSLEQLLQFSFFLPVDVVTNKDIIVFPVRVTDGETAAICYNEDCLAPNTRVYVEGLVNLTFASKAVAFSVRKYRDTTYIVYRTYYGKHDFN